MAPKEGQEQEDRVCQAREGGSTERCKEDHPHVSPALC